jgi:enterochelin esterase-like enzyme
MDETTGHGRQPLAADANRPMPTPGTTRRSSMAALLGLVAAGCGGGGGSGNGPTLAGSLRTLSLTARTIGTTYPLYIYLPPDSDAGRATLPVVYLLDGESRFQTTVDIVEAARSRVMLVGIGNEAQRSRDYVPQNLCTPGGSGQVAFLDFIRRELIPYVEANVGGSPTRRTLLGHSHGGSFVLYALFNEPVGDRRFGAYLASDSSIDCMKPKVYGWESDYAAANTALPVRLHLSYSANLANGPFGELLQSRHYAGLTLVSQLYAGGHIGMIPQAFADALTFALV